MTDTPADVARSPSALPRPDADGSGAEGFGLSLVEAASLGVVPVGCRTGGVPEAVGAGIVLEDPDAIPRFIEAIEQGYAFVQASRFLAGGVAENTPKSRDLAIRFIHAPMLSLASGFHWTDTTQGFRAYSRAMLLDPRADVVDLGLELL